MPIMQGFARMEVFMKLENISMEIENIDLPDKRLKARAKKLLQDLSQGLEKSIPNACGGYAETKAAYRFFEQDSVTPESILFPHIERTIERMTKAKGRMLLVNDSTDFTMKHLEEVDGLGVLSHDQLPACLMHTMLAFDESRTCFGLVENRFLHRTPEEIGKKAHNNLRPIEEKESYRWIQSYRRACELQSEFDQEIVFVADREADIVELFVESKIQESPASIILRSCHNRTIIEQDGTKVRLNTSLKNAPVVGELKFTIPSIRARKGRDCSKKRRKGREVTQKVKVKKVMIRPPSYKKNNLPEVELTVICCKEVNTPDGGKPVDWNLLTTMEVCSFSDVENIVNAYLNRWGIETFFHVLKTGCRVEKTRFHSAKKVLPYLSIYLIIAWRVMLVTYFSRSNPTLPCTVIFTEKEWHCIYTLSCKKRPPKKPPPLEYIAKLVASRGGYQGRKSDGPPGVMTIWRGLRYFDDFLDGLTCYQMLERN